MPIRGKYHKTPLPGYKSLLERIFGREMRTKKGLGDVAEYRTNKANQLQNRESSQGERLEVGFKAPLQSARKSA